MRRALAVAALLPLLAGCAAVGVAPGLQARSQVPAAIEAPRDRLELAPDAALQRLVDPVPDEDGLAWLGGDVASSLRLDQDRYAWLFGDTLLGRVSDRCPPPETYCDRRVDRDPLRGMIPNSIGIATRRSDGKFGPIVKYWRTVGGIPAPIFAAEDAGEFLWPLAGRRVGEFLIVVASRHTLESGLTPLGNVLLRIENPDASPDTWVYTRHPVPNVHPLGENGAALTWATALVRVGDYLYLFGERGAGFDARTVVARLPVEDVVVPFFEPMPEYLMRASRGDALLWSARFDPARLYELDGLPGISEASIDFSEELGWHSYQIPPFAFDVHLYTAPCLTGPWSDRGSAYHIPAPWSTTRTDDCGDGTRGCDRPAYVVYAAKGHPELAPYGGHAVSYNVNLPAGSRRAAELAAESTPGFYVPQLVSQPPP